ncbi:hypothetical protein [Roseibium sp. RKSG952]|uniref:hypothetical protein n=1 Tax=Roseibium sp. RKSG952 TaxID=2529384 RepID=UPI0012BB4F62|nr:hypothetical protein [Roseibium sp. RKSG952]MTH95903.1 hypothetical protein [Roseibium sp. RKSG952]
MAKVKLDDLEADIVKAQKAVKSTNDTQKLHQERLAKILGAESIQNLEVDMADDDFEAVFKNQELIQANLAGLVQGLDQVTLAFGQEFKQMAEPTTWEAIVGFLSKNKAEQLRSERVKTTSVEKNLNELIRKSDIIGVLLKEQLAAIDSEIVSVKAGQAKVQERTVVVAKDIEALKAEIDKLNPELDRLEARMADLTGDLRKSAENERDLLLTEHNEKTAKLQEVTAVQQSLERYARQYQSSVESLTKQKAAQNTMIEKLAIDTEQRSVLYDALEKSLRTSQQQSVAHRIDDIGKETDAQVSEMMLQIGTSSENRIMSMMEVHEEFMKREKDVQDRGKAANMTFARRFADILEKVDTGKYVEN